MLCPSARLVQCALTLVLGPSQQPSVMDFTNLLQTTKLLTYPILESTLTCEPCVSFYGATINNLVKFDNNQFPSLDCNPNMKETFRGLN
jgi:hypothetical protein